MRSGRGAAFGRRVQSALPAGWRRALDGGAGGGENQGSGGGAGMTLRVYLTAARLAAGPPEPSDLPAERLFVHASEVPEVWVETESRAVPPRGRAVAFALARPMALGVERITGTGGRRRDQRGAGGEPGCGSV